ncbi:helix-turn-helix transcriptional regulator [Candidatus Williamhamiltonella defendens]|uniref:Helix-turn-helix transcriptional regulator n=2 Tax=Candidatus Williamhamiltonella defendens TaxID=138072 RepID=A0A2D3SZZ0_9ENTR|nr:helix-turn-helix transcriptional regulator [Candidatus Hamiltonella defensa]ATW29116.1 helix-turn-helix transcriptional regulator [Candidatus Hamiltonella defensa]ATW31095.1 helix-turn-helix transcriptional regulator [Candidatus Hamiltonella defensa]AYB49144.1 helix-turn-helix transcriptional regulator [Candidatus Hamiltonella defensa]
MNSLKKITNSLPDTTQASDVLPPQFVMLWETSQEPWGVKDVDSKYIYANRAYYRLLNINPATFCIVGHLDDQLPSPIADFAPHFQQHDRQTMQRQDRLCSIEIHPYEPDQLMRPYYFDKYPLYEAHSRLCIGTIFHARKVEEILLKKRLLQDAKPGYFLFYPPENIFTEKELEVIFCVLQNMSSKLIALHLGLSHRTVENKLQVIYEKAGTHSLSQFNDYCRDKGYHHYFPQKLLSPASKLLDMSL